MKKYDQYPHCPNCETLLVTYNNEEQDTIKLQCPICGYITSEDDSSKYMSVDYTKRCGNCGSYLGTEDEYCKCCGTKRSDREFNPESNFVPCIYGSPRMLINRKKSNRSIIWMIILILSVIGCICLVVGTLINLL